MSSPTTFENHLISQVLRNFKPRLIRPTTSNKDQLRHSNLQPGPFLPTPLVRQQSPKTDASFFRNSDTIPGLLYPNAGL